MPGVLDPRILGLGDNTVDTYVDSGLQFPGGNAVNVAVLCRRLGARSAYLGCLGGDEAGDLLRDALAAEGVDVARCRRIDGANARARIAHNGGDRRFIGSTPGVRGRYDLADADYAYIARHDLTHSSIYSELEPDLPRIAAAAPLLSFDFSERWTLDYLARTLPYLDIAFLSYPGQPDAACTALLAACADRDVDVAVITRGAAGAIAHIDGQLLRQGVVPTTVVDTLGAGDGFIAGFLMALLAGAAPADCLLRGAENAARICTWQGAFGHGRPWRETPSGPARP
ncbi:MAG: fructoselysine kinase [Alphaproteobacteria bacterium]|nr:fructoselysine kinase [Alphaproteobacteria bacterium]